MKQFVFFDCDGTLLRKTDVLDLIRSFVEETCGISPPRDELEAARNASEADRRCQDLLLHTRAQRKEFYVHYNQKLLANCGISLSRESSEQLFDRIQDAPFLLYPDTLPTLTLLADAMPQAIGVLANWSFALSEVLQRTGIASFFSLILSSHDLRVAKPDPSVFREALHRIGPMSAVWYVGDNPELDVFPALTAGMQPVLIDRHQSVKGVNSLPCPVLRSLEDVPSVILGIS